MPMAINSAEEYEKVMNVSWFSQEQPVEDMTYVLDQSACSSDAD